DRFYQVINGGRARVATPKEQVIASMNNGNGETKQAPMTLANVAHNITPKTALGDNTVLYSDKPVELSGKTLSNAATVGDVLNAGFNLKQRGNNKDFVQAFDTLDIIDGAGTTAQVTTDDKHQVNQITFNVKADHQTGIKVTDEGVGINIDDNAGLEFKPMTDKSASKLAVKADGTTIKVENNTVKAKTTELQPNQTGKINTPADGEGDALVTAQTVADVINNSGFTLTTDKTGTGTVTGKQDQLIKAGEKVTIEAGDNIAITQDKGRVSIRTKREVDFGKVTVGDDTDEFYGVRTPIRITSNGMGGHEQNHITGLTHTLQPAGDSHQQLTLDNDLDISSKDADSLKLSRAATVADALSTGFNLQENGVAKDFVKAYDTIDFVDGQGARVMVDSPAGDKKNTIRVDLNLDPAKGLEINQEKGGLLGIKL
ncbi:hypothetical protein G5C01_10190, partial [Moraxella bovoculi]|nr:hypothetical protein [Moraxella bovoculi]